MSSYLTISLFITELLVSFSLPSYLGVTHFQRGTNHFSNVMPLHNLCSMKISPH
jgi:hypothetical protein